MDDHNIISLQDSASGAEAAFWADGSILFRRGLPYNTEVGIKLVRGPDIGLAFFSDIKWQVLKDPIMLAVDLGLSYWRVEAAGWVGYHPALIAGTEKLLGLSNTTISAHRPMFAKLKTSC